MKGYIYKIYNDINDKVYIGKTTYSITKRFQEHCNDRNRRPFESRPLYSAMNKYGIEHFFVTLIEECDISILDNREIYWIETYHSYSNGYNATLGGEGKILYDYDYIIQEYNKGRLCKEIQNELQCDTTVINRALQSVGIDTHKNINNLLSKPIKATFKDGNEKIFDSVTIAAQWLKDNDYTDAKAINGIITNIGRVAKGINGRKSYLKIKWEYL